MSPNIETVEEWPIDKLTPYARNARTHSPKQVDQIASSINEWGFTNPIIADAEGNVIAGHGRLLASQKLGLKTVPVRVVTDWPEAKKKAYILADNKLALNAGWDEELLRLELEELKEIDFDLDLIGFEDFEIASISFDSDESCQMPELPSGDKSEYMQMTFILHNEQESLVKEAISHAKKNPLVDTGINPNSNGNALFMVCNEWLKIKNGQS